MAHSTQSPIDALRALGQSPWLDTISRELVEGGELERYIREDHLEGVTSNPTIFEKAIAQGESYDAQIRAQIAQGASDFEVYDALTTTDIRNALDLFGPLYESSRGAHGYVSLEVSPLLANNTKETLSEARRLWKALDRPNAMIKIPGTPEGLPAIEEALADGININVTLLFGVPAYEQVARTYIKALRRRLAAGQSVDRVASVASFFVSRIDTEVDKRIDAILAGPTQPGQREALQALKGRIAIANAKNAYAVFQRVFAEPEFAPIREAGGRVQRVLWASVGTKNPAYRDTLYVDELVGPDTVSTMPPETFEAVKDHAKIGPTLAQNMDEARVQVESLAGLGIDFDDVTQTLLAAGVKSFSKSFESLMETLASKRGALEHASAR